jgi:hypothetical protein
MAEINWNDPEQRREYERRVREGKTTDDHVSTVATTRRGGAGWLWIVLIVLVGAAVWYVGWGAWGHNRGNTPNSAYNKPAPIAPEANTGNSSTAPGVNGARVATIPYLLSNHNQFQGHEVVVPRAIVQRKVGNDAVLVSALTTEPSASILVKLPDNAPSLQTGSEVQITGRVENGHPEAGNPQEQDAPGGFYLQASAITPAAAAQQNVNR